MEEYKVKYNTWLNDPVISEEDKQDLRSIQNDEKEIEDRFYKDLEFGTAGLRGVIGIGTNRMNKYTVTKASQGLALLKRVDKIKVLQLLMTQEECQQNLVNKLHFV